MARRKGGLESPFRKIGHHLPDRYTAIRRQQRLCARRYQAQSEVSLGDWERRRRERSLLPWQPPYGGMQMNRFAISIIAPAILAWSLSPAEAAGTIAFGGSSAGCGRAAMCSSDGTHGYLTNGKG